MSPTSGDNFVGLGVFSTEENCSVSAVQEQRIAAANAAPRNAIVIDCMGEYCISAW
jgi:hypothetical protein